MLLVSLLRAFRRRCPACGARPIFTSWFAIKDRCDGCGLEFEREDGYWLGAMIVNIAVTELVFLATLLAGMAVTWPDVPWTPLLVAAVGVNIIVPIVFQPFSRTVWVALDLGVLQRFEPAHSEEERRRRNAV